jgi:hypothetical protein
MIEEIKDPVASVSIRWVSADQGGRRSGPPTAPVYAATAVFALGDDASVRPGWPATADQISILVQRQGELSDGSDGAVIDFLAPELAQPFMHRGAGLVIMEGPKVVAHATVTEVLKS